MKKRRRVRREASRFNVFPFEPVQRTRVCRKPTPRPRPRLSFSGAGLNPFRSKMIQTTSAAGSVGASDAPISNRKVRSLYAVGSLDAHRGLCCTDPAPPPRIPFFVFGPCAICYFGGLCNSCAGRWKGARITFDGQKAATLTENRKRLPNEGEKKSETRSEWIR